jgi:hypothetical protein
MGFGSRPDFLILGAQKAGTTSLFRYIVDYSENFAPPLRKEIQYFTENYEKSPAWYCAHFPLWKRDKKTGEASPTYFFYHKCAERIHESIPNARFVVLLRNPVDRAYSHYNFLNLTERTAGFDPLSFDQAVREEENRLPLPRDTEFTFEYKKYSYKARGRYYEQLSRWLEYFPLDQFLIIETEELSGNPRGTLEKIFGFLGLRFNRSIESAAFRRYNENKYEGMSQETRKYLEEYFRPFNEKLFSLIGRRFDW